MIKKIIYISGIAGVLLLVIRLLGIFIALPVKDIIFIAGLILLFVVCFPLLLIEKNKPYRSAQEEIQIRSASDEKHNNKEKKKTYKSWGMNDSPYRSRKSGLTWGGGNITAANAKRASRRRFLKK